jgi:predicted DNA-binding protein
MKQKKLNISLWIRPDILERLNEISQKFDIKRSQLITNLIIVGYDEIQSQKNLGIIKLTLALKKYTSKINKLFNGAKKQIIVNEEDQRGINLSLRVDPDLIYKIDQLAQKIEMSRSTFIEYILENSIRNIRMLDFVGVLDSVMFFEKLRKEGKNIWKKLILQSEQALDDNKITIDMENGNSNK